MLENNNYANTLITQIKMYILVSILWLQSSFHWAYLGVHAFPQFLNERSGTNKQTFIWGKIYLENRIQTPIVSADSLIQLLDAPVLSCQDKMINNTFSKAVKISYLQLLKGFFFEEAWTAMPWEFPSQAATVEVIAASKRKPKLTNLVTCCHWRIRCNFYAKVR